jgi:hypothetical protein
MKLNNQTVPSRNRANAISSKIKAVIMERITNRKIHQAESNRILSSENVVSAFVFFFFLVVYAITLCPAVFWWDSGELIANIAVLGIPHRPGFPIYLLLGKIFSLLPLWSFALRINLMSALFAAGSLAILYRVFLQASALFFPETTKQRRFIQISGLFSLLVFGFTYSFWIQAVRAEVYSLNALFFSLLFYLSIQYLKRGHSQHIFLFFFFLGLGLGNHHLSLLSTVPAFAFLLLSFDRRNLLQWSRIPFYVSFLLLGLSVYLYLPIRSMADPPLTWGNLNSVSSSAGSIFALDSIRNFNFEFLSNAASNIETMIFLFSHQLTLPCFVLSLMGLFVVFRKSRKLWASLLILIAGNCAAVLFMASELITTNPDLHGYLIYSIFVLIFFFGFGIFWILQRIEHSSPFLRWVLVAALGTVSLLPLAQHHSEANLSQNRIAHNYGFCVISDLDLNSVFFADNVNLNFILRELQYAENIREDVTIIDRGLLGFEWYMAQKREELKTLFTGIPENATGESLFRALLQNCLRQNKQTYIEFTEQDSSLVHQLMPRCYVFKVSPTQIGRLSEADLFYQSKWDECDPFGLSLEDKLHQSGKDVFEYDWDAQRVFALSFFRLGLFYEWKGMTSQALEMFSQVAKVDPYNQELLFRIIRLQEMEALSGASNISSRLE